ncbi:DUF2617 family protein [Phytohabitans suffuscus]|uniref:DUF2617 domain-containing protein n=1 Tax=Phytohabitans suffuscus TaxID=624315 RepID=A0A6F8YW16_9ACTN|nr:DUF2617 family protein [Phytohabitans suffuscus]BCB90254.1 hypothetical protein Psuf_075670 [Phytohabitans suffuscus]
MLVRLDTPYADTTAGDLSFALGLPELPALHVLRLPGLELRLLGASHQVIWTTVDGERCVETVACLPGRDPRLPPAVDSPGYAFSSTVEPLPGVPPWRELAADPRALVGVFPGDPNAVTALRAQESGWCTWHAYPQTGELVTTRTRLGER